ncbi:MAG TPA: tyrosine-type recombinase/integrase [Acidimicrobiales bacterium]
MTSLRQHADEYLRVRRALGFKLRSEGFLLASFVAFADQSGAQLITTELVMIWTLQAVDADLHNLAKRMRVVRSFARYLYAIDPRNQVPPDDLCPGRGHRPAPYIYSDAQIAVLMHGARSLDAPLLAITLETLIGLLAATGLRIGEAIALDRGDVSWDESLLSVRDAKYRQSREVLLHPTTVAALRRFVSERDQLIRRWIRASLSRREVLGLTTALFAKLFANYAAAFLWNKRRGARTSMTSDTLLPSTRC